MASLGPPYRRLGTARLKPYAEHLIVAGRLGPPLFRDFLGLS
jgi:hypothetical protein